MHRVARDFLAGVQRNIRTRIAAEWLTNLKMIFVPDYSRTVRAGELYESDDSDATVLYDLLEQEVIPLYYDRDETGLPTAWVRRMKEAIATVAAPFSSQRMVAEYTERLYAPPGGTPR